MRPGSNYLSQQPEIAVTDSTTAGCILAQNRRKLRCFWRIGALLGRFGVNCVPKSPSQKDCYLDSGPAAKHDRQPAHRRQVAVSGRRLNHCRRRCARPIRRRRERLTKSTRGQRPSAIMRFFCYGVVSVILTRLHPSDLFWPGCA